MHSRGPHDEVLQQSNTKREAELLESSPRAVKDDVKEDLLERNMVDRTEQESWGQRSVIICCPSGRVLVLLN